MRKYVQPKAAQHLQNLYALVFAHRCGCFPGKCVYLQVPCGYFNVYIYNNWFISWTVPRYAVRMIMTCDGSDKISNITGKSVHLRMMGGLYSSLWCIRHVMFVIRA